MNTNRSSKTIAAEVREAYADEFRMLGGTGHYEECWRDHIPCVLSKLVDKIERLESELADVRAAYIPSNQGGEPIEISVDGRRHLVWPVEDVPVETPAPASKQYNYWTHGELVAEIERLTSIVSALTANAKPMGYICQHCGAQIIFGDGTRPCPISGEMHAPLPPAPTSNKWAQRLRERAAKGYTGGADDDLDIGAADEIERLSARLNKFRGLPDHWIALDGEGGEPFDPNYMRRPAVETSDGYMTAFYQIADLLGLPAMPISPKEAFETVMLPRLRELLGSDTTECSTCNDTGEIDETLGGYYFSNPHAPCPDCRPVKTKSPQWIEGYAYGHKSGWNDCNAAYEKAGQAIFSNKTPIWPEGSTLGGPEKTPERLCACDESAEDCRTRIQDDLGVCCSECIHGYAPKTECKHPVLVDSVEQPGVDIYFCPACKAVVMLKSYSIEPPEKTSEHLGDETSAATSRGARSTEDAGRPQPPPKAGEEQK